MNAVSDSIETVADRLRAPAMRPGAPLDMVMKFHAHPSGPATCRWELRRWWHVPTDRPGLILPWIMLNPSTADGRLNDPTLRRIIGFSWRWGFDGLLVVNLFPYRSAKPAELREWLRWSERQDWDVRDRIWENEDRVRTLLGPYDAAMAAWGSPPGTFGYETDLATERVLDRINDPDTTDRDRVLKLFTLGQGRPTHPMARGKHRIPDGVRPMPIARYPGSIVGLSKDELLEKELPF